MNGSGRKNSLIIVGLGFVVLLVGGLSTLVSATVIDEERSVFGWVAAGTAGELTFRTRFLFVNENQEAAEGYLSFFLVDGTAFTPNVESFFGGEAGKVEVREQRLYLSLPEKSTLEIVTVPGGESVSGWAQVSALVDLHPRAYIQISTATHDPDEPAGSFESSLREEAGLNAIAAARNVSFPVDLFLGHQYYSTAFSVVNLSGVSGKARLTLRPGMTQEITLLPGQVFAEYFDRFWVFAVPAVAPFKMLSAVEVDSDVPVAVSAFRTAGGLPISAVPIVELPQAWNRKDGELNEPVTLSVGEALWVPSEELEVGFWDVVEDSRCASDVTCVQLGRARIAFRFSEGSSAPRDVVLSTEGEDAVEKLGDYVLRLIKVEPAPVSSTRLEITDYRVTIDVSKY